MTPQLEMQLIVEAVGECWHEWKTPPHIHCVKCGLKATPATYTANPSHQRFDDLIRLSEKLGYTHIRFAPCDGHQYAEIHDGEENHWKYHAYKLTKVDALRGALMDSWQLTEAVAREKKKEEL